MPNDQKKSTENIVEPLDIFSKDPLEIAASPELRAQAIEYLRNCRTNVMEAEASGKRITKKVAQNGVDTAPKDDPVAAFMASKA